jgi:hypothetical protein
LERIYRSLPFLAPQLPLSASTAAARVAAERERTANSLRPTPSSAAITVLQAKPQPEREQGQTFQRPATIVRPLERITRSLRLIAPQAPLPAAAAAAQGAAPLMAERRPVASVGAAATTPPRAALPAAVNQSAPPPGIMRGAAMLQADRQRRVPPAGREPSVREPLRRIGEPQAAAQAATIHIQLRGEPLQANARSLHTAAGAQLTTHRSMHTHMHAQQPQLPRTAATMAGASPLLARAAGESIAAANYVQRTIVMNGASSAAFRSGGRQEGRIELSARMSASGRTGGSSDDSRRPARTLQQAAPSLSIARRSAAASQAVHTASTAKPPAAHLSIAPRAPIAATATSPVLAPPSMMLRRKEQDAQLTDSQLQLEHKAKSSAYSGYADAMDAANLDYRRQAPPPAPAEPERSEEPQAPQIDMAELQEMVQKLPIFDIKKMTDRVYKEIERKMRFERQTRGL